MKKRLLAVFLSLGLLFGSLPMTAAAQEGQIAPWALDGLCEAESLGLLAEGDLERLNGTVSAEKLKVICAAVSVKLDRLRPAMAHKAVAKAGDVTRGGVLRALYDAAYAFDSRQLGAVSFLTQLGVVQGDQSGNYHLDRACTLQETLLFAQRLVLALYDRQEAGTRGLLWKVEQGENTLYLYGSYHVSREEVYPLHRTVRQAVRESQSVCLEVDFGDTEGARALEASYYYPAGDSLKKHLPAKTYREVVEVFAQRGYAESTVERLKAWTVGNLLESFAYADEGTGTGMAVDMYLYSKALCNSKTVRQVESYTKQKNMLNGLTAATQTAMVEQGLELLNTGIETGDGAFSHWMSGDLSGFETAYGKDAPAGTAAERELERVLFRDRDGAMAQWCRDFLEQAGSHTATMVVGAGHMVGRTGIVRRLEDLGYRVEPM